MTLPGRYVLGDPTTRFAVMWYGGRCRWLSRPPGGVIVGHLGLWWSR